MKNKHHGWSIEFPDGSLYHECVKRTRQDVTHRIGSVWKLEGQTNAEGWQRAYRQGFRAVKIRVVRA